MNNAEEMSIFVIRRIIRYIVDFDVGRPELKIEGGIFWPLTEKLLVGIGTARNWSTESSRRLSWCTRPSATSR